MNKCAALSVLALISAIAMATAYAPMATGGYGGYYSYVPMHYGGGGGGGVGFGMGGGGAGGSLFSIIFVLIIMSMLGKGNLFGKNNNGKGRY